MIYEEYILRKGKILRKLVDISVLKVKRDGGEKLEEN